MDAGNESDQAELARILAPPDCVFWRDVSLVERLRYLDRPPTE